MKCYPTEGIRNICLVGSKGVGKTSLAEAILFHAKVTNRLGKIDQGNTFADFDPLEIAHKQTLTSKVLSFEWKETKINLLDTPGYADFIGEALAALWISDCICLMVDASLPSTIETKKYFDLSFRLEKPLLFFVNRLDVAKADWQTTLKKIHDLTNGHAVLFQIPWGEKANFKGLVDLIEMKAYCLKEGRVEETAIPQELEEEAKKGHTNLLETAAETNEALMEKYLGQGELTHEELKKAILTGIAKRDFFPVLIGSMGFHIGAQNFLNGMVDYFPSPLLGASSPFAAQVFKITSDPGLGEIFYLKVFSGSLLSGMDVYNTNRQGVERIGHLFIMRGKERIEVGEAKAGDILATAKLKNTFIGDTLCLKKEECCFDAIPFPHGAVSFALKAASRQEQDKLGLGLSKLMRTDPTFQMHIDKEFAETIVSGMGEQHIEIMVERLKERYGVAPLLDKPHIPYRETITQKAQGQGKYKRQTGGHGQYGDCWLRLEPLSRGKGVEFTSEVVGGAIPSKYIPSVEKGAREALHKGVLAGYPVVDIKVTVYDGSYHDVDSSDLAFQIAASMAFKKVQEGARPILLEPIMHVEITTPPQYVGEVTSDISTRRGKIQSMENATDLDTIKASIPLAELYKYSTRLKSITSGAATYLLSFSHYEPVPPHLVSKIVDATKQESKTKE